MEWPDNTDLENMIVSAAAYGGPMAIARDPNKFTRVYGTSKPIIRIFTASGHLITTINVCVREYKSYNFNFPNN